MDIDALRQQLTDARAHLVAALQGASESDFNAELTPGLTVVVALADLAREERATVEEARRLAGLPPRPSPSAHGEVTRRFTPPPVMHDLAGARHETSLLVDVLGGPEAASPASVEAAAALVRTIVATEEALAAQIASRVGQKPGATPPA